MPEPAGPQTEGVHASVSTWILVLGLFAYLGFTPVFWMFELADVAGLNLIIGLGFGVALWAVRAGFTATGVGYGAAVVVLHGWWVTLRTGWDAGFHYPILLGTIVQSMISPLPLRARLGTSALISISYVALWPATRWFDLESELTPDQIEVFQAMNLATFATLLTFVGLYYSEQVLAARVEQSAAEAALRRSLHRSQTVVAHMADGLLVAGAHGETLTLNQSLQDLLGGEHTPDELVELVKRAIAEREVVRGEIPLAEGRVGAAVASPLEEGQGAVALVRDVTREREIDRMKTEFTATVSHELRTPLTSVLGFAKMIRNRLQRRVFPHLDRSDPRVGRAAEQIDQNLDIILSEGKRLSSLINDVLDIAKMESGSMKFAKDPVDVAALVGQARDATAGLFVERPVRLQTEVAADLPELVGDGDRLQQVLVNLISNASKFTERGSVTLVARRTAAGVRVEVRDTGPGIPEAELEAVFDRFHQVGEGLGDRPKGTGLGLPICRHIVVAHGGTIHAESAPGEGSTFVIELPAAG